MRTNNEKRLLLLLLLIAFLGGNYYGYLWLAKKQTSLQLDYAQLRADQAEAKVDLQESDLWAQRLAWIHDHEPPITDEGQDHAVLLAYVKKGADVNKLDVQDQSLKDIQHGAAGTRMDVSIKVKGSMQDICKWLTDLQKPDQFYAISNFSLNADQDQKSMVCSLQISRYFKDK
jgi:hypothetical protein